MRNKVEVTKYSVQTSEKFDGNVLEDKWKWEKALQFVIFLFGDNLSVSCFRMREMWACLWIDKKEPVERKRFVYKPDYKIIAKTIRTA